MVRLWVILRHTFLEAILQPIYSLLLAVSGGILVVFALLPFFTLGEDTVMFKAVGLDVIMVFVLIATLFATSRSIYEEIEDRTMLTLMSKPVTRLEVLVGKYLGIVAASLLAIGILGAILMLCTWWRIPADYQISGAALNEQVAKRLSDMRSMHLWGLAASLVLMWLQISVLAAVGVAISTRVSLVVNLPAVILLYIAGNLMRFIFPLHQGPLADSHWLVQKLAYLVSLLLPYLKTFDLRDKTVYGKIALAGTEFADEFNKVSLGDIWGYVGVASLNAVAYAVFALAIGLILFSTRDLGGAEG